MNRFIFLLFLSLTLLSCDSTKEEKQKSQFINPNDIKINKVVQDSLTTTQIDRIKKIHSTFAEVYPISLEETLINFRRDENPDSEIEIWLQMVDAYEKYLKSRQKRLDLSTKEEVFALILSRSMMSTEEAIANCSLKILTVKDAKEVLSYYTAAPEPIDVVVKPY
jgi:type III secretory pathway component EscV